MSGASTLYDRVGGQAFFERLTCSFYRRVQAEPVLAELYPKDPEALEAARLHLEWFLVQFWGGPDLYRQRRGEPRLRMRHAPFRIGKHERDLWYEAMAGSVKEQGLGPMEQTQLLSYFSSAATAMINVDGDRTAPS
jgi:hemoglobin